MDQEKVPRLVQNWISTAGAVIAAVAALIAVFFLALAFVSEQINPYVGILIYLVLPGFLIFGLLMIPLGMYLEWRRRQRTGKIIYRKWPMLDLNNHSHRKAFVIFLLGSFLFLLLSSVGMYQAYHYTESVEFCGLTCHRVMHPEYTAYQNSPHARVSCVECHIGPGAGWFAKSKIEGLYQVYAVLRNTYPRPIPTPIEDLRPAQETCEQCHWPQQFFGSKQRLFEHFQYNRENTPWPINMLVKIGGGNPKTSRTSGIHWHMNIAVRVEYFARDERRLDIPWIQVTDRATGRVTVYEDRAKPASAQEREAGTIRVMDCMDCHNRPSHDYRSPDYAIDLGLATGMISPDLPEIKRASVEAMTGAYRTPDEAVRGIAGSLTDFYRTTYPDISSQRKQEIKESIKAVQGAYLRNIFPIMNADWSVYPNDIGHFIFPGCMRCHDGNHASAAGTVVTNNCTACHIILSQGPRMSGKTLIGESGLEFVHPVDIGDAWQEGHCYECHTGAQP